MSTDSSDDPQTIEQAAIAFVRATDSYNALAYDTPPGKNSAQLRDLGLRWLDVVTTRTRLFELVHAREKSG